jgi:hydroxyacylglutathione hydrolase
VSTITSKDEQHHACEVFRVVSGRWRENCYIVVSRPSRHGVIIDPGSSVEEIGQILHAHGVKTLAILLTHAHYDHVEGVAALREKTQARVYLHQEDLPLLRNVNTYALAWKLPPLRAFVPDALLAQDETLNFADLEVVVLHLPGHSPGSVAYAIGQMLFVGDTILPHAVGRVDLIGGNAKALDTSVKKIVPWLSDQTTLFPGHGDPCDVPSIVAANEKVRSAFLEARAGEQIPTDHWAWSLRAG